MTDTLDAVAADRALKAKHRAMWGLGDYPYVATDLIAELGPRLVEAAGDMPILGPNCYGFLNALDMVTLWPDQHGLVPVERGVAIVGQSSNVAINLTMQRRGLPIAYVLMAGNLGRYRPPPTSAGRPGPGPPGSYFRPRAVRPRAALR